MAHAADHTRTFGPERRLTGAYLIIALVALFVGVVTGLLQALSHAGINLYPQLTPVVASYYQGLTVHGVMNALVWTTFFICGFLQFIATRAMERPLASRGLAWATYGLMAGGLVLAAVPLLGNAATVMFTFYPPLQAHWAFYVGLTLVVAYSTAKLPPIPGEACH
jgi:cytochrome c oxidase subunit 1